MDQSLPVTLTTAAGLPRSLAPCFQEYDLERIDPAQHAELVIERVLAYGDRRELRWLFDYYGRARVTNWVQRMGARWLPWRRYNLWCVLSRPATRLAHRPAMGASATVLYCSARILGLAWFGDQKKERLALMPGIVFCEVGGSRYV